MKTVVVLICCPGSSPRVWGTRRLTSKSRDTMRFIPTRVGNTSIDTRSPMRGTVHPHACGEHGMGTCGRRALRGSSPRVWGTLKRRKYESDMCRFIPTRVGNTTYQSCCPQKCAVHPHACGEHLSSWYDSRRSTGSSPRVWGTLWPRPRVISIDRFIPTRVGNTHTTPAQGMEQAVHPHACGGHHAGQNPSGEHTGSSPRVWGTRPV